MSLAETIEGVLAEHRASRQLARGYCVGCGLAYEGFDEHEAHQAEMVEAALGVEPAHGVWSKCGDGWSQLLGDHKAYAFITTTVSSAHGYPPDTFYRVRALESPVLPDGETK